MIKHVFSYYSVNVNLNKLKRIRMYSNIKTEVATHFFEMFKHNNNSLAIIKMYIFSNVKY